MFQSHGSRRSAARGPVSSATLTIKGITRETTPVNRSRARSATRGATTDRVDARGTIDRKDFGLTWRRCSIGRLHARRRGQDRDRGVGRQKPAMTMDRKPAAPEEPARLSDFSTRAGNHRSRLQPELDARQVRRPGGLPRPRADHGVVSRRLEPGLHRSDGAVQRDPPRVQTPRGRRGRHLHRPRWCHLEFARQRHLHFPRLADFHPKGEVARRYGVYDDDIGMAERALFIVDSRARSPGATCPRSASTPARTESSPRWRQWLPWERR